MHSRTVLLVSSCSLSIVAVLCSSARADTERDPREIVNRYRNALLPVDVISAKISEEGWAHRDSDPKRLYPQTLNIVYRRDRGRTEWVGSRTRHMEDGNDIHFPIKETMGERSHIWAYDMGDKYAAIIRSDFKERQADLLDQPMYGSFLDGLIFGNNHQSVADLLINASDLHSRGALEEVNGRPCYVVEAATDYGVVTAWIDPNAGYTCPKWTIRKDSAHLFDDHALKGKSWLASFESTRTEQLGDAFIVAAGHFTLSNIDEDGKKYEGHHVLERTEINLAPDFEASGAFTIAALDLPDGSVVTNYDIPGIRFSLKGGDLVPIIDRLVVEELDKATDQIIKERGVPPISVSDMSFLRPKGTSGSGIDVSTLTAPLKIPAKIPSSVKIWQSVMTGIIVLVCLCVGGLICIAALAVRKKIRVS